jgi:hypothetical protein
VRAHNCPTQFTSSGAPPGGVAEAHGILKPNISLGMIELSQAFDLFFLSGVVDWQTDRHYADIGS